MLQGRLDAVQATNITLQQLAARREAKSREPRPVRVKGLAGTPDCDAPGDDASGTQGIGRLRANQQDGGTPEAGPGVTEEKTRPRKAGARRKAPACPRSAR